MRDHQPVPLLHFRRKSRLRDQNDPPAILAGRFRRVVGAERAPGLPKRRVRTGTRLISYQLPQDSQFVRKQGLSRTGCSRTVVSYGNRAFPVPDASGQSVRTETGRFSYRMRDHQPAPLLHFRRKSRLREHQPVPLLHFRRKSRLRNQNDPPAILAGRFRRVGGAEMAPVLLDGQARTGIRRFPYRMLQES